VCQIGRTTRESGWIRSEHSGLNMTLVVRKVMRAFARSDTAVTDCGRAGGGDGDVGRWLTDGRHRPRAVSCVEEPP
jgi:hypothetical protein